ncbi:MAG: glycosyltransferase family 39 protein, partial [Chloroflexi bacterium]|nr:glycosyltransferase family 39 protein [Chloroflexota bacterium]
MSLLPALQCAKCHAPLATGSAFCSACGEPAPIACSSCGHANRSAARFCGGCGAALASRTPIIETFTGAVPPLGRSATPSEANPATGSPAGDGADSLRAPAASAPAPSAATEPPETLRPPHPADPTTHPGAVETLYGEGAVAPLDRPVSHSVPEHPPVVRPELPDQPQSVPRAGVVASPAAAAPARPEAPQTGAPEASPVAASQQPEVAARGVLASRASSPPAGHESSQTGAAPEAQSDVAAPILPQQPESAPHANVVASHAASAAPTRPEWSEANVAEVPPFVTSPSSSTQGESSARAGTLESPAIAAPAEEDAPVFARHADAQVAEAPFSQVVPVVAPPAAPRYDAAVPPRAIVGQPLAAVGMAAAVGLAVLAQTAVLRTHGFVPAVPLFLAACVIGGFVALWLMPREAQIAFGLFQAARRSRAWQALLALAVLSNAGCLFLFGRNGNPNLAWLLWTVSVVAVGLGFWMLDGRPRLKANWREEAPWLIALGVITLVGLILRVIWLDSIPYGLWFDAAYSGLQIDKIISDPTFRPVYVGGLAQEPAMYWYMAVPFFKVLGPTVAALRLPGALAAAAGVPIIYLLGREMFNRKTGIIAAGLLATLVWNLTFSRFAANVSVSVPIDALGLFFLVRALKKASWTSAALAGISLGLGLHLYYTSRVMILVAGFAFFALLLVNPRERFQTAWRVVLAAALAGIITGSPIGEFAKLNSAEFNSRMAQASIFKEVADARSIQPILGNLQAHLLMFNYAGDRNARHNLPSQPELNFLLAGLFILGLGISLARARGPEYLLMPVWFLAMLAGGVFSVSFEAPQSLRTIDEINVIVLACAIPLALLWEAFGQAFVSGFPRVGALQAKRAVEPFIAKVREPAVVVASAMASVAPPATQAIPIRAPSRMEASLASARWAKIWSGVQAHPLRLLFPVWVLMALRMTDPLWRVFTKVGLAGGDTLLQAWLYWWTEYALLTLHRIPFLTNYMFAPQTVAQPSHIVTGTLSLPLEPFFGLYGTNNIVLWVTMILSSLCSYLLVQQETGSRRAAFLGSIIFTYAPYKFAHLTSGHYNIFANWGIPLAAMFLLRWLRTGGRKNAVIAGAAIGSVGLQDANQMSLGLVLLGVMVLGGCWLKRPNFRQLATQWTVDLAAMGGAAFLVLAPMVLPLARFLFGGDISKTPLSGAHDFSPDLVGYFTPPFMHAIWGKFGSDIASK